VHLHVIPRYATARVAAGLHFEDLDYPGHYAVPAPERRLSTPVLEALTRLLTDTGQRGRGVVSHSRCNGAAGA
jgi:hypothetical protein